MANTLQFSLGLAAGGFLGPLTAARAGVAGIIGLATGGAGIAAAVASQISRGGDLVDLSNRLGESVGNLVAFQRAFAQVGLSGDKVPALLNAMQRALGGFNENGEATGKIISEIGLNLADLRKLDSAGQIKAIGAALAQLPREQAALAAGKILGRGFGADLLQIARSGDDFAKAMARAGREAAVMQRYAGAFDSIGDAMLDIKADIATVFAEAAGGFSLVLRSFGQGQGVQAIALGIGAGFEKAFLFGSNLFSSPEFWSGFLSSAEEAFSSLGDIIASTFESESSYWFAVGEKLRQEFTRLDEDVQSFDRILADADADSKAQRQVRAERGANGRLGQNLGQVGDAIAKAFAASGGPLGAEFGKFLEQFLVTLPPAVAAAAGGAGGAIGRIGGPKVGAADTDALTRIGAIFGPGGGVSAHSFQISQATRTSAQQLIRANAILLEISRKVGAPLVNF